MKIREIKIKKKKKNIENACNMCDEVSIKYILYYSNWNRFENYFLKNEIIMKNYTNSKPSCQYPNGELIILK